MSLLDFLRYGLGTEVAKFTYSDIPLYLLLTAGIFIILYLILSSAGVGPGSSPVLFIGVIFSAAAAFLIMTKSFQNWFWSYSQGIFTISGGIGIAVVLIIAGFILYLLIR